MCEAMCEAMGEARQRRGRYRMRWARRRRTGKNETRGLQQAQEEMGEEELGKDTERRDGKGCRRYKEMSRMVHRTWVIGQETLARRRGSDVGWCSKKEVGQAGRHG